MSVHVLIVIVRGHGTRHCFWFTFSCLEVVCSVSVVRWSVFVSSHGQTGKGMSVVVEVVPNHDDGNRSSFCLYVSEVMEVFHF